MSAAEEFADSRARQAELYGVPLGDRVRGLLAVLGVSQARLARTLGISPAMLSQLASGRRVKIGSPAVLARLQLLDHRCAAVEGPLAPRSVELLLADVARAQLRWSPVPGPAEEAVPAPRPPVAAPRCPGTAPASAGSAADALRRLAAPARLAAAAAALGPGFPELAEVLRQAAGRPG
ncbi:XRE family transcriptional regulator [Pseudonocardia abyssalis]|uniref:XRE family transcriptional regulator n=1 Tax=Pseudonocardia abyssalis TaxID=2792008 RepID=A0ABS6UT93_9PSEU|nr:XRE family transcriptional regulator [Pseudonocardia abyssalis]MBW0114606.1 XRE family transcriptional regulator [Pseudonocardia abyssalis]MBW0135435.1 XRE family transcriptional regulator [Pseudonocardia abyssalis]